MTMIAHYTLNGKYTWIGNGTLGEEIINKPGIHIGTVDLLNQYHDNVTNQPVAIPVRPSINHVFDYDVKAWIDPRTLEQHKAGTWERIKVARIAAENAPFLYAGDLYDADSKHLTGAVQMATLAQMSNLPLSINWTLADNTTKELTAIQIIELAAALAMQVSKIFDIGRELRVEIETATNVTDLEAIVWPN